MKTASELATEYWDKPPCERINSTLQDYVYDYMLCILKGEERKLNMAKDYILITDHKYFNFNQELTSILTFGTYYNKDLSK